MPGLGVMVVVQQERRVLLTQREDFAVWCLPGGAADPNEQPDVAAIREVREETGLEIHLTRLVAVISRPHWGAEGRITLVFAGEPAGGTLAPDPREVLDLGFFAPDVGTPADGILVTNGAMWLSMSISCAKNNGTIAFRPRNREDYFHFEHKPV